MKSETRGSERSISERRNKGMDAVRTVNLWDIIKQLVKESQQAIEAKHLHFRYRMERVTVT